MGSRNSKRTADARASDAVETLKPNDDIGSDSSEAQQRRAIIQSEEQNNKLREKMHHREKIKEKEKTPARNRASLRASTSGLVTPAPPPETGLRVDVSSAADRRKSKTDRTWNKPSAAVLTMGTDDLNDPELEVIDAGTFKTAKSPAIVDRERNADPSLNSPFSPTSGVRSNRATLSLNGGPLFARDFARESMNAELFVQIAKDQQRAIEKQKKKEQKKNRDTGTSILVSPKSSNPTATSQRFNSSIHDDDLEF